MNDSGRLFGSRFRGQFDRWDLKTDFGFGVQENSRKIPLSAALVSVWFHIHQHCLGQKSGFYWKTSNSRRRAHAEHYCGGNWINQAGTSCTGAYPAHFLNLYECSSISRQWSQKRKEAYCQSRAGDEDTADLTLRPWKSQFCTACMMKRSSDTLTNRW